ncbi:hypothetical protein SAMN05428988_1335 [Chitinophaga sp. YR573]|nr:hypothetical protein SAMN05428988_1335 [Chitinophaga sp. YR573]
MKAEYWISVLESVSWLLEKYSWMDEMILGLQPGDQIIMVRTGDNYTVTGWEQIKVTCEFVRFDFPFIITSVGSFHYSRLLEKTAKQLKLF